ncbi:MAG: hypothetical protein U9R66_12320 [Thermodesulfobacteriota bacterium]|nr:hypothetical protein [Thermodesulfobacteriota bacterium]
MRFIPFKIILFCCVTLSILPGCSSHQSTATFSFQHANETTAENFWLLMEEEISRNGVRNSSAPLVSGFPYLRTNRFLTALSSRAESESEQKQFIEQMRRLDLGARFQEVSCLPDEALAKLCNDAGGAMELGRLKAYISKVSARMMAADMQHKDFFAQVVKAQQVEDEYSLLLRTVGLYPLTSLPVLYLTSKSRQETVEQLAIPSGLLETQGNHVLYAYSDRNMLSERNLAMILGRSLANPLRLPLVSVADRKRLIENYAPVISQDVAGTDDQFGRVGWDGDSITVDSERPAVYYYLSQTMLRGYPALQVNYVIWFANRSGPDVSWLEQGRLDGLTFRYTLDWQGQPVFLDIVQNCGCYHFFVPDRKKVKGVKEKSFALDGFVPVDLPERGENENFLFQIRSGNHQMAGITTSSGVNADQTYELLPYEQLEMLPYRERMFRSLFDGQGIAHDSSRPESWLLFPMGLHDTGSMRQRGHHAIRLVGREHFDDPHLFDNNFFYHDFPLPESVRIGKKGKSGSYLQKRVNSMKALGRR